jgi:hypothetical protein
MPTGESLQSELAGRESEKTRIHQEIEKIQESLHLLERSRKYPGVEEEAARLAAELDKLKQEAAELG